jgi:hypothetical protein
MDAAFGLTDTPYFCGQITKSFNHWAVKLLRR